MSTLQMPDYPISFGAADEMLKEFLSQSNYSSIAVLVDENTKRDCLPLFGSVLDDAILLSIPSGESNKTIETCQQIWASLLETRVDRKALLINIGGGVIGDMGGFVASTYKRGIDFIQIPTTLLSQVDASVGGKLGVDFNNLKNVIGLFRDPKAVLIDQRFFATLSKREMISGWAEMLKHALIDSPEHWQGLQTVDPLAESKWQKLVLKSVSVKKAVVLKDPFEMGPRKMLNFGHTYGHAYETLEHIRSKDPASHGACVGQGMMIAIALSVQKCDFDIALAQQVIGQLSKCYAYDQIIDSSQIAQLREFMGNDKKNEGSEIRFCLLESIGQVQLSVPVNFEEVQAAMIAVKEIVDDK